MFAREVSPPEVSGVVEGVTTLGQKSVTCIRLNVAVLIQVSVLNVGTNTQYRHSTHAPMAALSVFPLKARKES